MGYITLALDKYLSHWIAGYHLKRHFDDWRDRKKLIDRWAELNETTVLIGDFSWEEITLSQALRALECLYYQLSEPHTEDDSSIKHLEDIIKNFKDAVLDQVHTKAEDRWAINKEEIRSRSSITNVDSKGE